MSIGPYIVVISEEYEPTGYYLLFYYTYDRLDMFRALLRPEYVESTISIIKQ